MMKSYIINLTKHLLWDIWIYLKDIEMNTHQSNYVGDISLKPFVYLLCLMLLEEYQNNGIFYDNTRDIVSTRQL